MPVLPAWARSSGARRTTTTTSVKPSTYGISRVQLDTGVPCAFGVLTVDDMDQALARTGGGKRDSGYNAAFATVQMARLVASLRPAG